MAYCVSDVYHHLYESIGGCCHDLFLDPYVSTAEEIHQFVVQAADAMQLAWPPTPESFQELPRPMQSRVDEGWFQRPDQNQGRKVRDVFPLVLWVLRNDPRIYEK